MAMGVMVFYPSICHGQSNKPNILLVVADDLGYSDLSCYGSEIQTPHIDQLAKDGVRFNKFYVSPMCVTSRAALIAGMEYMAAGKNNIPNAVSIASLMRDQGYATHLVGKNHGLGNLDIADPSNDFGFDHFYGFTGGQINSFTGEGNVQWQEDGRMFEPAQLPADFYATDAFTDYSMAYMKEAIAEEQPFFGILAYNAPHSPLDAPLENVRKYYDPTNGINVYEKGWEQLRIERLERMKQLGIVDEDIALPEFGVEIPDWDALPQTSKNSWDLQQDFESLSRSAYAGMVDRMDENVGRIIQFLKDPNNDGDVEDSQLENTLIIFISDNGGCYAGSYTHREALPWSQEKRGAGFTTNYGWAALSNTPFGSYKHGSGEGAIRSPMVVHWPKAMSLKNATISNQMLRIWDLYPTFLEIAGGTYPADQKSLMGQSFLPLLQGKSQEREEFFVSTFYRSKGIVQGKWKLVSYYDSPFELYNLEEDPTEICDVRDKYPKKFQQLLKRWNQYTIKEGFENDLRWNMPTGSTKRGFGYDRLNALLNKATPDYMSDQVPTDQKLTLNFKGKITFAGTTGKSIRLQKYGSPDVIWSKDFDASSLHEGKTSITFTDFPTLEADSHYYITWDAGWVKVMHQGKWRNISPVRESAFAYRFKTMAIPQKND
ncbi:sulfatase-like hydrolase/transferase [Nonlabens xiamenensis]|uniref:sulfatase-like hydrolase/transferase n=1 Tax=Nonlabens xiamenensis TaxID=2341043 RepID=UPI0013DD90CF|nr:sulfatase-like hydrolase/transferase [Nonlabens xiamenensis]